MNRAAERVALEKERYQLEDAYAEQAAVYGRVLLERRRALEAGARDALPALEERVTYIGRQLSELERMQKENNQILAALDAEEQS